MPLLWILLIAAVVWQATVNDRGEDMPEFNWIGVSDAQASTAKTIDRFRLVPATDALRQLPGEKDAHFAERIALCGMAIPWMDFCMNALTRLYVYDDGPTRALTFSTSSSEISEWWDDHLGLSLPRSVDDDPIPRNVLMRQTHEESSLHGTIIAYPFYDPDTKAIDIRLYNPWQYNVMVNERDRRKHIAVRFLQGSTLEGTQGGGPGDETWEVWTKDDIYIQKGMEYTHKGKNRYGFIPGLRIAKHPIFYDYLCHGIGDDLHNACKLLIQLDMEHNDLMYWLYSQPVLIGKQSKDGQRLHVGKGHPVQVEVGGDYKRQAAGVQMKDSIDGYQNILNKLAMSIGLAPGVFNMKVYEASEPSGAAIREAITGPLDSREANKKLFVSAERRLAVMIANILSIEKSQPVEKWLPLSYNVTFPSVAEATESEADKREKARMLIQEGGVPWRVMKYIWPDGNIDVYKELFNGGSYSPTQE